MKKFLQVLLAAITPLILPTLYMGIFDANLAHSLLLGALASFGMAWRLRHQYFGFVIPTLIVPLPLSIAWYLLIQFGLQGLWYAIPVFFLAAALGSLGMPRARQLLLMLGLLLVVAIVGWGLFPSTISDNLIVSMNQPAPAIEVEALPGNAPVDLSQLRGQVTIIDYFGTWCRPCIAELPELKAIQESLSAKAGKLEILLVCTGMAGDTPEKALKFKEQGQLDFPVYYDPKASTHAQFKFTGVPAMIILDKKGNIRYKREGFNGAEDLPAALTPLLEELLAE